jgi:hypothetical protein
MANTIEKPKKMQSAKWLLIYRLAKGGEMAHHLAIVW